jgi:hypothetical protein
MDFVSDSLANGTAPEVPDRGRRLQPRVRGHRGGLRHQRAVRDAPAGPGGAVPGLPSGRAHRQRPGVHQPGLHRLGAEPRHPAHPDRAGQAHAERLHRELQRQVPRRVPERALVRDLHQARTEIGQMAQDYNEVRPHSSIGRIPPARFAEQHRRACRRCCSAPHPNEDPLTFNPGCGPSEVPSFRKSCASGLGTAGRGQVTLS